MTPPIGFSKLKSLANRFIPKSPERDRAFRAIGGLGLPLGPILIICKGNICRSSYGEYRLKKLLEVAGVENVSVISAGIDTTPGLPADTTAQRIAALRGIDLSAHRTQSALPELVRSSALILVMEKRQQKWLLQQHPELSDRVVLLGAMDSASGLDIEDPYGRDDSVFHNSFDRIDASLCEVALRLPLG